MTTATKTAKRGRPSAYRPEFVKQASKLCALAATDMEIAEFFEIDVATLYRWKAKHADFCEALKVGKEQADNRVERSLYQRAVGYSFDSEKIITVSDGKDGSHVERIPIVEHVPPDTTAQIFWLKNRRRNDWRDKQDIEHTGKDGGPIETRTDFEIGSGIAFALRKAAKT